MFKEEEKAEKKQLNSVIKESKKKVRDEFLSNFFLPLRKEFEIPERNHNSNNRNQSLRWWRTKEAERATIEEGQGARGHRARGGTVRQVAQDIGRDSRGKRGSPR